MAAPMGGKRRTPKEILDTFEAILNEAAKFYNVPAHQIAYPQWVYIGDGRLSQLSFRFLGTYNTLREYFAPSPNKTKVNDEALNAIRRILEKTKKQKAAA